MTVENTLTGAVETIRARLLVNAAGPWVDEVLTQAFHRNDVHNVRLVQGSHIVVPKKFDDPRAYFFQNKDSRIIFAIPYEDDFTLIGTTDNDYRGDLRSVKISDGEIDYLCEAASEYFAEPVRREDIVWTYSAVRPLYDDGATKAQEATREYLLKEDVGEGRAPLVNSFGGKITTYRRLAEAMLDKIGAILGAKGKPWTHDAPLSGGEFGVHGFAAEVGTLCADYPFLGKQHATRLVRLYGTRARKLLGDARSLPDLGQDFGADLYQAEIRYLFDNEFALSADDVLWRRTKRGLHVRNDQVAALETYMASLRAGASVVT